MVIIQEMAELVIRFFSKNGEYDITKKLNCLNDYHKVDKNNNLLFDFVICAGYIFAQKIMKNDTSELISDKLLSEVIKSIKKISLKRLDRCFKDAYYHARLYDQYEMTESNCEYVYEKRASVAFAIMVCMTISILHTNISAKSTSNDSNEDTLLFMLVNFDNDWHESCETLLYHTCDNLKQYMDFISLEYSKKQFVINQKVLHPKYVN